MAEHGNSLRSIIGIVTAILIAVLLSAACGAASARVAGLPAFALLAAYALVVQWLAFIPAYLSKTERYYDLVGAFTYISVAMMAMTLALSIKADPRALLLTALVGVWALRLGRFLYRRIHEAGSDRRFDRIKSDPMAFLLAWTLQGLWVIVTAGAAVAAMTSLEAPLLGVYAFVGTVLWCVGFAIEVIADCQKRRFRRDPANRDRFITSGLWGYSRHPNYLGEITLWFGVAVVAYPALSGWQHVALVSPLFVYLLLTRVSGIPLLEAQARQRWGDEPGFRDYLKRTPALFPRLIGR